MALSDPPIFDHEIREISVVRTMKGNENKLMGMGNRSNLAIGEGWGTTEGNQACPLATMPMGSRFVVGQYRDRRTDYLGQVVFDAIPSL
jgi:hypothetical protein